MSNNQHRPADLLDTSYSTMRCPKCGMHVSFTGINEPYCAYIDCLWNNEENRPKHDLDQDDKSR